MQNKKGFTLIELLVVIAIIGILSGMIIVSMSGAQDAAKGSRIKAAMDQFRTAAEIFNATVGLGTSYGAAAALTTCDVGTGTGLMRTANELKALCDDIQTQGSGALVVVSSPTAWCIQKVLPGTPATTWCVDSAGSVGCIGATGCASSVGNGCSTGPDYTCK
jgi:prepilin-type N-terminal cleavage/methylation domain-containing protein